MKLPNLLESRRGRLVAFFFLYVTEGIPLGFAAIAIATEMRRQGVGPADIGAFVGAIYLPWAWKWAIGPFVDVLSTDRFGRRRMWIVITQVLMVGSLLLALPLDVRSQVGLFTWVIILHNIFSATQDVAIDALAAQVLFLTSFVAFPTTYFFVAACILSVTVFIALPLKERPSKPQVAGGSGMRAAAVEIRQFIIDAYRAFTGSRGAFVAVIFALMPAGAYALGLSLQSNLAVELGMSNNAIATLGVWSSVVFAICCAAGGWLSDRFGRRRMLALYLAGTTVPTFYMATAMTRFNWIMPMALDVPDRPAVPAALVTIFWSACLVFAVFNGLMYGTRSALFMDVTTPAVAATQFTAYMALMNFVIQYSARWQGLALERWGYPTTLMIDGSAGLLSIALLPFIVPRRASQA
jgi:PAT family beta-lactamase induction signal transducer AmpG